ncbi:hypothetical protein [Metapseudomonas resinovorans]|uniref:Uncharacterized protein n=1 Tax=Metapseudomonas resinovorans NBRC 106553 TaxID=1245471 RepID=S6AGL9_METRE|nr:hypothetical protein [Pseudomonas resinovorans]BAN47235.1 hypothetical protein PCA10_15030 [Pseudomonas resinovorans NBRC 106553]
MNDQQQKVERVCAAPSGVGAEDWQALEWQLLALALDATEEGEPA